MNEVFQLYTGVLLGTPKGQQQSPTTVIFVEAHPVYFIRFTEKIYVESSEEWFDVDTFLPVPKMKKDKIVGAVMPNYANSTLIAYIGPEFESLKQQASDSAKRKPRITDVPVIEEIPVEVEVIKTVAWMPPLLISAAIWIGTIAAVYGALT